MTDHTSEGIVSLCLYSVSHLALSYCIYVLVLSPPLNIAYSHAIIIHLTVSALWTLFHAPFLNILDAFLVNNSPLHLFFCLNSLSIQPLLSPAPSLYFYLLSSISFPSSFRLSHPFCFPLFILFSRLFFPLSLPLSALIVFIICHSFPLLSYHSLLFHPAFALLPILVPADKLLIPYHPIHWKHDPEISEQKDHLWSWEEA